MCVCWGGGGGLEQSPMLSVIYIYLRTCKFRQHFKTKAEVTVPVFTVVPM